MIRILSYILTAPVVLLSLLWCVAALWIDGPTSRVFAGLCAASIIAGALRCFVYIRPMSRAVAVYAIGFAVVLTWWLLIPPSNERPWLADVAELPQAVFDGDKMTVHNIRNFTYRSETDYDPQWDTRVYDLADIKAMDLYLVYWGPTLIAHTILSWDFEDENGKRDHLAISIETRKEEGEEYSAVLGFFRQFELYYVVSDERDVVGLRANHRGEEIYLYRFNTSPDDARKILLHYFGHINELVDYPSWYNAMTHNCTTAARKHTVTVAKDSPWDYRFLFNGSLDQLGHERGAFKNDIPFEELRRRSNITDLGNEFTNLFAVGLGGGRTYADTGVSIAGAIGSSAGGFSCKQVMTINSELRDAANEWQRGQTRCNGKGPTYG